MARTKSPPDTLGSRLKSAIAAMPAEDKSRGVGLLISKIKGAPGANYPSINGYLKDEVVPPLAFIEAAAAALGVRKQWLAVGGSEPRTAAALDEKRLDADQPPEVQRFFRALEEASPTYPQLTTYPDLRQSLGVLAWRIGIPLLADEGEQREVVELLDAVLLWPYGVFCPSDDAGMSVAYLRSMLSAAHNAIDTAEEHAAGDDRLEMKREIMRRLQDAVARRTDAEA